MVLDGERELLTLGRYACESEGICGNKRRKEEKRNRERDHNNNNNNGAK